MKQTRVTESWSRYNLPQDLWREIFSRIPVKSLLQFRCVSRSWQSLINDPEFHRMHLDQFRNNCDETHLFVVQGTDEHCMIRCSISLEITEKLGCLRRQYGSSKKHATTATLFDAHWLILLSVDGLVLLRSSNFKSKQLMLWNPSIKKTRCLPPSPEDSFDGSLAFGFDSLINDYTIIRAGKNHEGSCFIAVYTVGTDSWKTIWLPGTFPWCWPPYSWRLVYYKGHLYFLGSNKSVPAVMVSFNLSSEMIASIPLPAHEEDMQEWDSLMLVDGGLSLALYRSSIDEGSIWVLESSGDNAHWTKRCTFAPRVPSFFYVKKNGDMLIGHHRVTTMFNVETHKEKQEPKSRNTMGTKSAWGYKESLFLLN